MKALFDAKVKLADTITATNQSVNYLPSNIKHKWIAKRFQSLASSSVITITLDDSYPIDCFFYGLHNLNALTAVLKNSGGSTLQTIVVSTLNDIGVEYFTEVAGVKTIELTVASASSNAYLGGCDAGVCFEFEDFLNSYPINLVDNSLSRQSKGGQITNDNITPLFAYAFQFRELLKDNVDDMIEQYIIAGKTPIFIDPTPGDRTKFAPIYGQISKPPKPQKANRRWTDTIEIRQAR